MKAAVGRVEPDDRIAAPGNRNDFLFKVILLI